MKIRIPKSAALLLGLLGVSMAIILPISHGAQGIPHQRVPVPYDWSHHHVKFSIPSNFTQAWKVQQDPRYWHQRFRMNPPNWTVEKAPRDRGELGHIRVDSKSQIHKDWALSLSSLTSGTASTGGAATYPAKFGFDANAAPDCVNDYVAFNTSLPGVSGAAGTPNVIALNQLYSSQNGGTPAGYCGTSGPSVMWSYFTGTGTAQTSIVLALAGDKMAFVETSVSGGATLRILRGVAGEGTTVTSPQTPTNIYVNTTVGAPSNTAWNTTNCPNGQSCLISVAFQNGNQDTNSSPYYDYQTDTLYVGDNGGVLHAFSGVFLGTPAEVTTGGWPITVDAGTILTSPVADAVSGNIFVGDSDGSIWYVRGPNSSVGSCASGVTLPCLGSPNMALTGDIVDGPLLDSTTGRVFWFNGTDTTNHGEVVQTNTALGNSVTLAGVGGTGAGSPMYDGDFDNNYFTSSPGSVTGFLYFSGKVPGSVDMPALWRVGFNSSGVMNSTPDGGSGGYFILSGVDGVQGSPVTEVYNTNTSTDWIFYSVSNYNYFCNFGGGCVMSTNLTTMGSWPSYSNLTAYLDISTGGASGIVVDNVALTTGAGGFPQASSIYFTWQGGAGSNFPYTFPCNSATTGGCIQKLTQDGLQ